VTSRTTVSVDIEASRDEVWRVVAPIEDHVRWMRDAVAITFTTEQRRGVGTRFEVATKVGPLRLTDHMTITEWTEGECIGVRHTALVTGAGRFALSPITDSTTRFSWTEQLRFPWWLGGRATAAAAAVVLRAIWRRNLQTLKQLVEAAPST
jgi:hypothetical protein